MTRSPRAKPLTPGRELGHHARALEAEDRRRAGRRRVHAPPLHQVRAVHRGRSHRDPQLARPQLRAWAPRPEPSARPCPRRRSGWPSSPPCYPVDATRARTELSVSLRACARSRCWEKTGRSSGRSAWPSCPTAARWPSRAARSRRPTRTPIRTRTRRCWCAPTRGCCSRSPTASTAARSSELAIAQARARATELVQASGEAFRAEVVRLADAVRGAFPRASRSRSCLVLAALRGDADRAGQLRRLERLAGRLGRRAGRREHAPARRSRAARARAAPSSGTRSSRAPAGDADRARLRRRDELRRRARDPGPARRGARAISKPRARSRRPRSRRRRRQRRGRGVCGACGSVRASRARSPWRSQ